MSEWMIYRGEEDGEGEVSCGDWKELKFAVEFKGNHGGIITRYYDDLCSLLWDWGFPPADEEETKDE